MKRRPFVLVAVYAMILAMGLTGCSRTVEDVAVWKAKANIQKLIKALTDPKMEVRIAAAEALGELKAEPAVDHLASLYNDPEEEVILTAVEAIAAIGTPSVSTPMIAALSLDYPVARKTAAVTLGHIKSVGAVEPLGKALDDAEAEVQLAAAKSLGQIGEASGSPALVGKLSDSSRELRQACAESLGLTGGDAAAEGLIEALADSDKSVRDTAKDSLVELKETSVPFALQALRHEKDPVRAGAILVLRQLEAIPKSGDDFIWYLLARESIKPDETIDENVIKLLFKQGDAAIDVLLLAAAHTVPTFRGYAALTLEQFGESALEKALDAADTRATATAAAWFSSRGSWPGAPSWRIDLWAAVAALNPDFNLDAAKKTSLEMQGRPAFTVVVMPQFKAERAYVPLMISLLGDRTAPPPEEPDYDADGIPVVKKKRDMFRGEANQQTCKEKLAASVHTSTFPLLAAIEDEDELIAGHAAAILGDAKDMRALDPLMNVVGEKLNAGKKLTHSPFYIALQKLEAPEAEPLLQKIRPNADRAMYVFARKYPDTRPMSAETKDTYTSDTDPIEFRIGYIDNGRVAEFTYSFAIDQKGVWLPSPALPEKLSSF